MKQLLIILFFSFLMINCTKTNQATVQKQGVKGTVVWLEGNLMPSIGDTSNKQAGKPIEREVYFCKPTKMKELEKNGVLFTDVAERMVRKVTSDTKGEFFIELAAGKYSVFTKETKGFFANSFDGEGNINIIEVKEGEVTEMKIRVNYAASY